MSIFGSILSAIFSHGGKATASASSSASAPTATSASSAAASSAAASAAATAASGAPSASTATVDVAAVMDRLAGQSKEKLDWRHSIVDLMKLLDLDSSLSARKTLATELHYTGNMGDSAAMNIWLHKQVMVKLAENGGKVPDDLRG
jgi:3-oxoacyl-ACP reductase-like protein